jgi:hypothetical protein
MKKALLLLFLVTSAFSLLGQQDEFIINNGTSQNFPTQRCWPDKIHLKKAIQVSAAIGTGGISIILPVGKEVWAHLSEDHKTVAIHTKDPELHGSVPVEDTDFLALALKNNTKIQETLLAQQNRLREEEKSLKEETYWKGVVADMKKKDILVKSWSWGESSSSYIKAVGEIQNESNRELKSIEVELITKDSSGNIVNTGNALVHDHTLAPNETTTFDVLVKKRGGEETACLSFRSIGFRGERYSFRIQGKD